MKGKYTEAKGTLYLYYNTLFAYMSCIYFKNLLTNDDFYSISHLDFTFEQFIEVTEYVELSRNVPSSSKITHGRASVYF